MEKKDAVIRDKGRIAENLLRRIYQKYGENS